MCEIERGRSATPDPEEIDHARELARDLEDEILTVLEAKG